jgi:hypothetical protein
MKTTQIAETLNYLSVSCSLSKEEKEAIKFAISNLFEVEKIRKEIAEDIIEIIESERTEHIEWDLAISKIRVKYLEVLKEKQVPNKIRGR